MPNILDLEPKRFWYHFNEICKIPHGSYNEAGLRNYFIKFAEEHGLKYKTDKIGNVVISKPANNSKSTKTLILQGHMDMVCEAAPGVTRDFKKDGIVPKIDGEWLVADGTSLGADNGVALAASLAVLEDKSLTHGPLECLMTVSEEVGMDGAKALTKEFLEGRTMLNLDSEEERTVFVGCAGGENTNITFSYRRGPVPTGYHGLEIEISGLLGGHSGLMIHCQRGNAIKLLGRVLCSIREKYDLAVSSFIGGTKSNVIPGQANAVIAVKEQDIASIKKLVHDLEGQFHNELASIDPGCRVVVKDASLSDIIEKPVSDNLIRFVNAAPHGVIKMSKDIEGLVQTSTNLASINTNNDVASIIYLSRSSTMSEVHAIKGSIHALVSLAGGKSSDSDEYPGWQPNMRSLILRLVEETYKGIYGVLPKVTAVHAGLECGIISERIPGIDMISFGPHMEDVHSINERVNIRSCGKFYTFLVKVLENFGKQT